MHLSKAVLSKEDAEKIAVAFSPRKFPASVTKSAHEFVAFNTTAAGKLNSNGPTSFKIDRLVAEQTGVAELERLSLEEKVEREALIRLKDFQEQAFQQAYQLGLDEGRERAFVEHSVELKEKLAHLNGLLGSIEEIKTDLVACNESQIVRMIYYMTKRLVFQEIEQKPEIVLEVVRQSLLSAQSDEKVNIRVSPSDFNFIDKVREKLGKEFEGVKRAKLEAAEGITSGGCVIETNFGDVNATLEQRLERIWLSIAEKLPKTTDVIGQTSSDKKDDGTSGQNE